MKHVTKRGAVMLGSLVVLLSTAAAQAQAQAQAAYLNNLMASARMMQAGPGMGGGFMPGAINPAFATGAGFVNPYTPVGGGFANPYTPGGAFGNPYGGGSGSGGYGMGFGGYYSLIPPQMAAGYFLMGTADIMKAYGSVVTADQQARIMAEEAKQAHIRTLKARFEYEMWRKANTIPYSEEQRKYAQQALRRVQRAANPNEIVSGKSLNMLLHDLEGVQGKKVSSEPINLSEDVLRHLNVTTKNGNLGLLRNDGRFTWPPALLEVVPAQERSEIELQAQSLVQKATDGVVAPNLLRDLQNTIEKIRDKLLKKVNDLRGDEYRAAKNFLDDFDSALLALREEGNAVKYMNYQKWITGGKTVQELVNYMVSEGLHFAPAVQGDEPAYRSLQSALAAYDIAYSNQVAAAAQANAPKDE